MYKWIVALVMTIVIYLVILPILISSGDWILFSLGVLAIIMVFPILKFFYRKMRGHGSTSYSSGSGYININGKKYKGKDLVIDDKGNIFIDGIKQL